MEPKSSAWVFKMSETGPGTVRQVFLEKGWVEHTYQHEDGHWNLWWKNSRFRRTEITQSDTHQKLNHFPGTCEITRKDSLCRHVRRLLMTFGSIYNFLPEAFILPNEYTKFVAQYSDNNEKKKNVAYICKPVDKARGIGIFVFKDLKDLCYDGPCVAQRYISHPLLIGGHKFDLRIYVLVTSFHPLNVFVYKNGLARFSTDKYDMNALSNVYSHLTNTSINKMNSQAGVNKIGPGSKWSFDQLKAYFQSNKLNFEDVWKKVVDIIILTLIIQADHVPETDNCFELYGFDILIDSKLKPWLLEVNFSPSLSSNCHTDNKVKKPLISDLLDLLKFEKKHQFELEESPECLLNHLKPPETVADDIPMYGHDRDCDFRKPREISTCYHAYCIAEGKRDTEERIYKRREKKCNMQGLKNSSAKKKGQVYRPYPRGCSGDFVHIFPFNEATHKASIHSPKIDFKAILRAVSDRRKQGKSANTAAKSQLKATHKRICGGSK